MVVEPRKIILVGKETDEQPTAGEAIVPAILVRYRKFGKRNTEALSKK